MRKFMTAEVKNVKFHQKPVTFRSAAYPSEISGYTEEYCGSTAENILTGKPCKGGYRACHAGYTGLGTYRVCAAGYL